MEYDRMILGLILGVISAAYLMYKKEKTGIKLPLALTASGAFAGFIGFAFNSWSLVKFMAAPYYSAISMWWITFGLIAGFYEIFTKPESR